jgi:hypothetical protein
MGGARRTPIHRRIHVQMTNAAIEAWCDGAVAALHRACGWKPWQISPFRVHLYAEPPQSDLELLPIFFQSWHEADCWRRALEDITGKSYVEIAATEC